MYMSLLGIKFQNHVAPVTTFWNVSGEISIYMAKRAFVRFTDVGQEDLAHNRHSNLSQRC